MFNDLAKILNYVEAKGVRPSELAKACVSLIPKDAGSDEPKPTDVRPISVLSAVGQSEVRAVLDLAGGLGPTVGLCRTCMAVGGA